MPSRKKHSGDKKEKSSALNRELIGAFARELLEFTTQKYLNRSQSSSASSSSLSKKPQRSPKSSDGAEAAAAPKSISGSSTSTTNPKERTPVSRHGSSVASSANSHAHSAAIAFVLGEVAVGLGTWLVKSIVHHRTARREHAQEEARLREAASWGRDRGRGRSRRGDADLRAGLDALSNEARQTAETLRALGEAPAHPDCEVQARLAARADGLQAALEGVELGVNNIRNLGGERLQGQRRPRERGERRLEQGRGRLGELEKRGSMRVRNRRGARDAGGEDYVFYRRRAFRVTEPA